MMTVRVVDAAAARLGRCRIVQRRLPVPLVMVGFEATDFNAGSSWLFQRLRPGARVRNLVVERLGEAVVQGCARRQVPSYRTCWSPSSVRRPGSRLDNGREMISVALQPVLRRPGRSILSGDGTR